MTLQSNFAMLYAKGLRNVLSVGSNGSNLIANKLKQPGKSYENIHDGSVTSYMEKNPDTINLEWYHHMKCWKTFCDEGMIRRQQRKEEKGEGTFSKRPTSTEVSPEIKPLCHKETRMCFQRYVSLFVEKTLLGFY